MTIPQAITGLIGCCIGWAFFWVGTAALVWVVKTTTEMKRRVEG